MATGRTEFELKTFLEGSKDQYDAFIKANGAEGVLFFDTNNHAVYAKDKCVIKSNVASVELVVPTLSTGTDKTAIRLTYFDGSSDEIDTAIPNAFVRFDATQDLTDPQKQTARTNIGAEAADATILKQGNVVNNLTTDSATVPLSAAMGKALSEGKVDKDGDKVLSSNDYTTAEKNKLDGIAEGAQVNKISSFKANNTEVGGTGNGVTVSLSGNLVDSTSASSGKVDFNLSMWHDSTNKKIHFFNLPKEQATATNVDKALFSIDTSEFVKDSFVESVTFNSATNDLVITFVLADGSKDVVNVELDTLMNVYKAENGIVLDGDTFKLSLGNGVKVEGGSLTLSLGNGLSFDTSGKLKVDFESNGVTSINGMGGGAYTINDERVSVGTAGNVLSPISVVNDSAAKKLKIKANPKHIFAQFFHENNADATSGIRAKGVKITEDADGNPYSMLMDFTPKVWSF